MAQKSISVSDLTRRIHNDLADFGPLVVAGELSQVRVVASGHLYGTLKDRDAVISIVCWRSTVARMGTIPKEGDAVLARGTLSVYGPRGQYQLTVTSFSAQGQGDLAAQFEELKRKLHAEGLFDDEHKKDLPFLPQGVGLATAPGSAALADMVRGLEERFPSMPVILQPCLVQGAGASASIAQAIAALDADDRVEVIILGRGGGSLEDLWAFNEEQTIRAIARCSKPIISAVGHETDTTLADYAADLRAKTPTMAAELVVPIEEDLRYRLDELRQDLDERIAHRLDTARQRLEALATHRALAGPEYRLQQQQQRLDELHERLIDLPSQILLRQRDRLESDTQRLKLAGPKRRAQIMADQLLQQNRRLNHLGSTLGRRAEEKFVTLCKRLDAYSPLGVIARGYAVIHSEDGATVGSVKDITFGDSVRGRLSDGWVSMRVEGTESERLRDASGFYDISDDSEES